MKKVLLILSATVLSIAALFLSYKLYDVSRYKLSQPMNDVEYKTAIIKASKNKFYKLENLRPLVGPNELAAFIAKNSDNPRIYTPTTQNIKLKNFQANFHTHSTNSDGAMSVKEILDKSQSYGETLPQNSYMYIAITDHNTILGAKAIIEALQKNPNKYDKVKIIAGIEINTEFPVNYSDKKVPIHVLAWCINPYDEFLNKEFYKQDLNDKWNCRYNRDFLEVIDYMSKKGIVGIAHPIRYITFLDKNMYKYIDDVLIAYKKASKNPILFVEGYYQSYSYSSEKYELGDDFDKFYNYVCTKAKQMGIILTGSTDSHGDSIFHK